MKIVKRHVLLTLAAVSAFSSSALAGAWMANYYAITKLENGDALDAYHVYMPMKNPRGCTSTDYYEVYPSATATAKDLMNRTLLSALLAGRKVKLNISTVTCGASGRPAYTGVDVAADQ